MRREDQYVLAPVQGSALLLDLQSGSIMELNPSASLVWRLHLAGKPPEAIASELSTLYRLDAATAVSHVQSALQPNLKPPRPPTTDFNYAHDLSGYVFSFRGQPMFSIDDRGDEVRFHPEMGPQAPDLSSLLHAVAPKLLALRGHVILHAAAVALGEQIVAFSGVSGAGKSTTARALANAGARLVCGDQMVVHVSGADIMVPVAGEQTISAWIVDAVSDLATSGSALCRGLDGVRGGQHLRLAEIGFVDQRNRTLQGYRFSELSCVSTAGAVFRNTFYGADSRADWKRALGVATTIGSHVSGVRLSLPEGLQKLADLGPMLVDAGTLKL